MDESRDEGRRRKYNSSMVIFKRYWALFLTAVLLPLLILLALLQQKWIGEIGLRERFRLVQGIHSAAGHLAEGVQNELFILPAVFSMGAEQVEEALESGDWRAFQERWVLWKDYSLNADILSELYLARSEEGSQGMERLWRWNGTQFVTLDTIRNLSELGTFAFPLSPPLRLLVKLDLKILGDELIPQLAERFLFGKTDYYFRILDTATDQVLYVSSPEADSTSFMKSDIRIPLFSDNLHFLSDRPPEEPFNEDTSIQSIGVLGLRRTIFITQGDPDKRAELFLTRKLPPELEQGDGARWILEAVHRAGSLTAAVQEISTRNTFISSGILMLLAMALVILAAATRRNQELAERQREFIASITHELKTPISVIRSAADNLAGGIIQDQGKMKVYGTVIRDEGLKLTDMIDSLLIYARIGDNGKRPMEKIILSELVNRVVKRYRPKLTEAGFRTELTVKGQAAVRGDRAALELALGNLVANVLIHAREGAFLGIDEKIVPPKSGANPDSAWVELIVRDKGPGIPRRERRLVFEAFYRGEGSRKEEREGSGLGLNLVYRIVRAHGGSVRYETQGRLGSAFILRLPLEGMDE